MSMYPYRKYARYPVTRRRRYVWRMNHDAWAMAYIVLLSLVFVALEILRGIQ